MSRRPLVDKGSIAKFAEDNTGKLKKATIMRINNDGSVATNDSSIGQFLLNPESWTETKSVNWARQNVPGQSHPILQWVSGGPRTVSFEALVTKDNSERILSPKGEVNATEIAKQAVGEIASNFAGANLPNAGDLLGSFGEGKGAELSIENKLNFYRSLLAPTYSESRLQSSPNLLILHVGKTLSTNEGAIDDTNSSISNKTDVWVLTNLDIQITKQLPNLAPMEASVTFQMEQYTIEPLGQSHHGFNLDSTTGGVGTELTSFSSRTF